MNFIPSLINGNKTIVLLNSNMFTRCLSVGNKQIQYRNISSVCMLNKPIMQRVSAVSLLTKLSTGTLYNPKLLTHNIDTRLSSSNYEDKKSPHHFPVDLMDFPRIVYPNLMNGIRAVFISKFFVPRYDPEFTLVSFTEGAKQALVSVSEDLASGDAKTLVGRVTSDCVDEVCKSLAKFSLEQKSALKVRLKDIFMLYPYHMRVIILNEGEGDEKMYLEISMCYHIIRDYEDTVKAILEADSLDSLDLDYAERISVANYRFIREFTKGAEEEGWVINAVNHFIPYQPVDSK